MKGHLRGRHAINHAHAKLPRRSAQPHSYTAWWPARTNGHHFDPTRAGGHGPPDRWAVHGVACGVAWPCTQLPGSLRVDHRSDLHGRLGETGPPELRKKVAGHALRDGERLRQACDPQRPPSECCRVCFICNKLRSLEIFT